MKRNGSENFTAGASPQILDTHSRWHVIGQVSAPGIGTHVTSDLHDQAVLFDRERAAGSTGSLGFGSLLEIFEMRPQQLPEVRRRRPFP